jgi:hypothetical protein
LLEVLVACGILIFALSGIAALLPAAGSIFADSVAEDRAAMLSANVFAELQSRDLFRASALASLASGSQALVLGFLGNPTDWATGSNPAFKDVAPRFSAPLTASGSTVFHAAWGEKAMAANDYRAFFLEDDLVIADSPAGPISTYEVGTVMTGTALGPRGFKRGAAWGATVTTGGAAPTPGAAALLSIATFKKAGQVAAITLTSTTGMYVLPAGQANIVKTYLGPGSYFLAVPEPASPLPPAWFQVRSSWTVGAGTGPSYVLVNDLTASATAYENSKSLFAIGFSGLKRLDQFPVILK